ncbi:MAG: hypothetical protein RLZZ283_297 [Candidatus Parcubacteria bacterium]
MNFMLGNPKFGESGGDGGIDAEAERLAKAAMKPQGGAEASVGCKLGINHCHSETHVCNRTALGNVYCCSGCQQKCTYSTTG